MDNKIEVPEQIKDLLTKWRNGLSGIPLAYIDWHLSLANDSKYQLSKTHIIHSGTVVDDGWLDGMNFMQLIVEHKETGKLSKIKWSDSQIWYEQSPSGGWVIFNPKGK